MTGVQTCALPIYAGDVILVMDKDKDQEIKHLLNDINETPEFGAFI